jgi:hypothetical protein
MTGPAGVDRETAADGDVRLSAGACTFVYHRARPGVLVVTITGRLYLTVAIAPHLSRTGNPIRIYSDPAIFEARLAGDPT